MQDHNDIAKELVHKLFKNETAKTVIEDATAIVGGVLHHDRSLTRAETIEACARVAEEQYSGHPDWDKPVYNARECGRWIATCIRSQMPGGSHLSNVAWKPPKRQRSRRVREDAEDS